MKQEKTILIIGDNEQAPHHRLDRVREQLESILGGEFQLEFTEGYERLKLDELKAYPVIVSYTDCWNRKVEAGFSAALVSYVVNGGKLLVIHNGISLQTRYELAQLIGAKFLNHPDRTTLLYTGFHKEHPVMKGVSEFTLWEEPYQFQFDPFTEKEILFYYEYEGNTIPAGWVQNYGYGKVLYVSPGHDASVLENETLQTIIYNSACWLDKIDSE